MHDQNPSPAVGHLIRLWRTRRRMTQMDLAAAANLSTRHLSFLENGRAQPSRSMVLALADQLGVPLRERNSLLAAAGYAPVYRERPLSDPALAAVRRAVELVLRGHEPFPALVIDRQWNMVAHNAAVPPLLASVDPQLLRPPINVMRLSLHSRGLAPQIVNLALWRRHLIGRLEQQLRATADPGVAELLREVCNYALDADEVADDSDADANAVVLPLKLRTSHGVLSFMSTTTVFGTPADVTVAELALETFLPADAATARALGIDRPDSAASA